MAQSAGLNALQRHHFFKSGHLILNEILRAEQCQLLAQELVKIWSERLKKSAKTDYLQARQRGRDLWRDSRLWASKLLRSPIGSLALQLWSRTPLRLLYDQLLFSLLSSDDVDAYRSFSLASKSAFEGIEGGILICLQSPKRDLWQLSLQIVEQGEIEEKITRIDLPHEVGMGIFIARDITVQLQAEVSVMPPDAGVWMLVVFGNIDARYIFNQKDPSRHALGALDYTVGDKLRDATHPLIKTSGGATIG